MAEKDKKPKNGGKAPKEEPPTSTTSLSVPPREGPFDIMVPRSFLSLPTVPAAGSDFLTEAGDGVPVAPGKFPLIQIDHKGGEFVLPSGEFVDRVAGYPLYWFQTRRYYKAPPIPGQPGKPPDCWSGDLVAPPQSVLEPQSDVCVTCDHAQCGSDPRDGRSQACKVQTWIFLANPDFGKPPVWVLIAPPSSIKTLLGNRLKGGFFQQAQHRYGAFQVAWSVFSLVRGGELHCLLSPRAEHAAQGDEARALGRLHKEFRMAFEAMRGHTGSATLQPETANPPD